MEAACEAEIQTIQRSSLTRDETLNQHTTPGHPRFLVADTKNSWLATVVSTWNL